MRRKSNYRPLRGRIEITPTPEGALFNGQAVTAIRAIGEIKDALSSRSPKQVVFPKHTIEKTPSFSRIPEYVIRENSGRVLDSNNHSPWALFRKHKDMLLPSASNIHVRIAMQKRIASRYLTQRLQDN